MDLQVFFEWWCGNLSGATHGTLARDFDDNGWTDLYQFVVGRYLTQGRRDAGTYALRWDGRDDDGDELASGVYLYRLQAGTQTETRKLLLLR